MIDFLAVLKRYQDYNCHMIKIKVRILLLTIGLAFLYVSKAQPKTYFMGNSIEIALFNEYVDSIYFTNLDSFVLKYWKAGIDFSFENFHDFDSVLLLIPDTFQTVQVFFNQKCHLPNSFFKLHNLRYIHIIAPKIDDLDNRFTHLRKLKEIAVTCDTLMRISKHFNQLKELEMMNLDVDHYYPNRLKKVAKRIVRFSSSDYLAISLGYNFSCWTGRYSYQVQSYDGNLRNSN